MVCDQQANFIGIDGTSRSLSNDIDRALLVHLRKMSELIITDAATASTENYQASRWAPIEVWSKSGNFRETVSTPHTDEHMSLSTVQIHDLRESVDARLRVYGCLLFESGPTLSKALGDLQLIDELCLTVTNCASVDSASRSIDLARAKLELGYLERVNAVAFEGAVFVRLTR